jgi:hypothetical protein
MVRNTIFNHRKLQALTKEQLTGNVLEIARTVRVAPVMVIRQLLKLDGFTKKEVKDIIEGTAPPPDAYKEALYFALLNDPVFSPRGVYFSKKRGQTGEELIGEWLDSLGIGHERDPGIGGPDFLLKSRLKLIFSGVEKEFDWIESKASYGDAFVLKGDSQQFDKYEQCFGEGLILYWFGIEKETKYNIITWREMMNLTNNSLRARIRSFIAFVPSEFKHLI